MEVFFLTEQTDRLFMRGQDPGCKPSTLSETLRRVGLPFSDVTGHGPYCLLVCIRESKNLIRCCKGENCRILPEKVYPWASKKASFRQEPGNEPFWMEAEII